MRHRLLLAGLLLGVFGTSAHAQGTNVSLLPIDAEPSLVSELRRYYLSALALDVTIQPPLSLQSAPVWDGQRRQIAAKGLARYIRAERPPAQRVVVIAVTSRDMYIEGVPWRFAFSLRDGADVAIVSYARMDPTLLGEQPDKLRLLERLRKMVTRNIGVLAYGLPQSSNRRSLMFGNILGVDDLDGITEDLRGAGFPTAPR